MQTKHDVKKRLILSLLAEEIKGEAESYPSVRLFIRTMILIIKELTLAVSFQCRQSCYTLT